MRRTKHVTSPYGVVTFSRVTAGILLLFSAAAVAKMSPAPVGRHREELYTADRRSPSFAGDFEAHMRPFFESKLKSGTALRRLPQEQYPRETDFLLLVSLWKNLSPEFKALYKMAAQIPGTFDSYVSPGGHFEIYYLPQTRDNVNGVAVTDTISCGVAGDWRPRRAVPNGIPDYVDEAAWALDSCWAMEVGRFSFVAPISYNDIVHTSSRYPVVITWQPYGTYGQTWPDIAPAGPKGYPSHFELRNDWNGDPWTDLGYEARPENGIRVTCAHELFHGVQYAMTWNVSGLSLDNYPLSWIEGTAVLMEELGFDSINDYLQYSKKFFNDPGMSFFNYLTSEDRLYSNSLLVKYLYEKTGGIGLVRTVFFNDYAADAPFHPNLRAVSLSSGSPWTPLLNRFHTASYYTGSRADTSLFFADAELMGQWTYQHDVLYGSSSVTKAVNPYGMRIFSLTPDSADGDTADFRLQCSAADQDTVPYPSWSASCIVRRLAAPDTILPLTIDTSGWARWSITGWKSLNDILIIASSGTYSETRNATVYLLSCPVTYRRGDTPTFSAESPDSQSVMTVELAAINDLMCPLSVEIAAASSYTLPSSKLLLSSLFRLTVPPYWGNDAALSGAIAVRLPHIAAQRAENSINNDSIRVVRWDVSSSSWKNAAFTAADSLSWRLWRIPVALSGTYGIFGSGHDTLVIFPNPGRLRAKKFIRFEGSGISEIRIYSTDGALVAASTGSAFLRYGNGFMWQLVNGGGTSVAPGCYTAVVIRNSRSGGGKEMKRHKIMVFP